MLSAVACHSEERTATNVVNASTEEWAAPDPSDTGQCADVRDLRVCWRTGMTQIRPRVLPKMDAPADLRCYGDGAGRRCVSRRRDAPAFRCEGTFCVQQYPRVPDDGEWECADLGGVVSCRGGERAAGIPPGGKDASFVCGARKGHLEEKICVDYSPDLPDGAGPFRCRFEAREGTVRVCETAKDAHGVTDACDAKAPCVSGLDCVSGHCIPPAPAPQCWLDADCGTSIPCRFGVCLPGAP